MCVCACVCSSASFLFLFLLLVLPSPWWVVVAVAAAVAITPTPDELESYVLSQFYVDKTTIKREREKHDQDKNVVSNLTVCASNQGYSSCQLCSHAMPAND